jgi:hypothetical protein
MELFTCISITGKLDGNGFVETTISPFRVSTDGLLDERLSSTSIIASLSRTLLKPGELLIKKFVALLVLLTVRFKVLVPEPELVAENKTCPAGAEGIFLNVRAISLEKLAPLVSLILHGTKGVPT